jgi:hypothetical protein
MFSEKNLLQSLSQTTSEKECISTIFLAFTFLAFTFLALHQAI